MYLSLRDITFARGRFALIGAVVALITLLLVLLTGLTNGLGHQNTSALERLNAEQFVFSAPADGSGQPTFTESRACSRWGFSAALICSQLDSTTAAVVSGPRIPSWPPTSRSSTGRRIRAPGKRCSARAWRKTSVRSWETPSSCPRPS